MGPILSALAAKVGPRVAQLLESVAVQEGKKLGKQVGVFGAKQINRPIDAVEDTLMRVSRDTYFRAKVRQRIFGQYAAAQSGFNPGTPGFIATTLNPKFGTGKIATNVYTKSIEFAFFNQNKFQAFTSSFARGALGETASALIGNRVIGFVTGKAGKGVIKAPAARGFLRSIRALRGSTKLTSPTQVLNMVKQGYKDNVNYLSRRNKFYSPRELSALGLAQGNFMFTKGTGYVAGRGATAISMHYIFVSDEEREKNVNKLKRSTKKWIKSPQKAYNQVTGTIIQVQGYRRADGTIVAPYRRRVG